MSGWQDTTVETVADAMFRRASDVKYNAEVALAPTPTRAEIVCETLNEQTFRHWTDGQKWVFDMYNVNLDRTDDFNLVHMTDLEVAETLLRSEMMTHATIYFIGHVREMFKLATRFPKHDIRLLLINK